MKKGKDIIIYENGEPIMASPSCIIETNCDIREISAPLSGPWRNYTGGRKTWKVSVDIFVQKLKNHLLHIGDEVTLSVEIDGERLTGQALCIAASAQGTVGSVVRGTWNFIGNGGLE